MPPPELPPQMPLREDGEEEYTPTGRLAAAARPIAGRARRSGLWVGFALLAAAMLLGLLVPFTRAGTGGVRNAPDAVSLASLARIISTADGGDTALLLRPYSPPTSLFLVTEVAAHDFAAALAPAGEAKRGPSGGAFDALSLSILRGGGDAGSLASLLVALPAPVAAAALHRKQDAPPSVRITALTIDHVIPRGQSHQGTITLSWWDPYGTVSAWISVPRTPLGITVSLAQSQFSFAGSPNSNSGQASTAFTVAVDGATVPGTYHIPVKVHASPVAPQDTDTNYDLLVIVPGPSDPDFTLASDILKVRKRVNGPGVGRTNIGVSSVQNPGPTFDVALSVSGMPSGMTATIPQVYTVNNPNPAQNVPPVLEVSVDSGSGISAGSSYTLTVTGQAGSHTHTLSVTVQVIAEELQVSVSPASRTINRTSWTTLPDDLSTTVTVQPSNIAANLTETTVRTPPPAPNVSTPFTPNPSNPATGNTSTFDARMIMSQKPGPPYTTDNGVFKFVIQATAVVGGGGADYPQGTAEYDIIVRNPPPDAPTDLAAVAASHRQINLTWHAAPTQHEEGFKVERRPAGAQDWAEIATVPAHTTAYADNSGLSPDTTYQYQVRAFTNANVPPLSYSDFTNVASAHTYPPPASSVGKDFWLAFPMGVHLAADADFHWSYTYPSEQEAFVVISAKQAATGTVSVPGMGFSAGFSVAAGGSTKVNLPAPLPSADPNRDHSVIVASMDNGTSPANPLANKGVHVQSDTPVSVSAMIHTVGGSEAFLCLPNEALGTEYIALDHDILGQNGRFYSSAFVTVVATADYTTIRVTPSQNAGGTPGQRRGAQVPYTVTLMAGQVYQLQRDVSQNNSRPSAPHFPGLTGTVVTSDKPVALITGADNSGVGTPYHFGPVSGNTWPAYANPLIEELPPVDRWGTEFVTVPPSVKRAPTNGNLWDTNWGFPKDPWWTLPAGYRVVAAYDGTWVRVNGRLLATLNRGEYVDYQANDGRDHLPTNSATDDGITRTPWRITANQPVLVAEYGQSNDFFGQPVQTPGGTAGTDDVRPKFIEPYMTLVPAVDQWDAGFLTSTLNPATAPGDRPLFVPHQSFSIVGTPAALADIQMDGVSLLGITATGSPLASLGAVPVDDGAYFAVTVNVPPGPHSLISPGNQVFGAVQYGLDDGTDAYGLPVGYVLPWHPRPPDNQPPLIKLNSPLLDQRYLADSSTPVTAHASVTVASVNGAVTRVEYQLFQGNYPLIDKTLVAEQSIAWSSGAPDCPFDFVITPDMVTNQNGGKFRLRATVYDDAGTASSAWTQFRILSPGSDQFPQVTITAPVATMLTDDVSAVRFGPGGPVSFTASADVTDDDNNLSTVLFELLQNDQAVQSHQLSAGTGATYSADFNNVPVGTYTLRVTGTDNLGKYTVQQILVFVLGPETVAPQPIRINCGGGERTVGGVTWAADAGFVGGKALNFSGSVSGTSGDTDPALLQAHRESVLPNMGPPGNGNSSNDVVNHFTYAFAVRPRAKTQVNLYFEEGQANGPGQRVFDVIVNNLAVQSGSQVSLEGVDVFQLANNTAGKQYMETLDVQADDNGFITLGFWENQTLAGNNHGPWPYRAMVSAIEILPDAGTLTCDNSSTNGNLSASSEIMTLPGSGGSSGNGSGGNGPVNFLTEDATTSGEWTDGQVKKYGTQGYEFFTNDNSLTQLPSYVNSVTGSTSNWFVWGTFTDPRFLRTPPGTDPNDRRLACWYNSGGPNLDVLVNFKDTETHQVALYMVDVNHENLAQTIQVLDTTTGTQLASHAVADFANGKYVVWSVRGNVTFRVTSNVQGKSAELMALFFDPAPSLHTATFVGADDQTRGDWATAADGRKYGTDGYACLSVATYDTLLPSYVSAVSNLGTPNGSGGYINTPGAFFWGTFTEQRFLRTPPGNDPNDRRLARWHGNPRFDVPVTFTDTLPHQVSLYMVDVNNEGLSQTIEVINPVTGQTLDSQVASNFYWGRYLTWTVRGNVTFRVTNNGQGRYAELMALFFDPGPPLNTQGGGYYAKRFSIDARSGRTLTATMTKTGTGSTLVPYLYLLAPEGYVVKTSNRNATQVSLTYACKRTGTYTLVATSDPDYPMTTGAYTVSLNCATNNTDAPVAPADLAARPVANARTAHFNAVELTWKDNSPDETGFDVYRRDSTTGDWGQPIATVGPNATASVTWRDTVGVQEDHVYYYKVVTNRDGVQSSASNDAVASTYLIPPVVTVLSPLPEAQVSGSAVTVEVSASAASGNDVLPGGIVLKNYGVPVSGATVTRHTDPATNHPANHYTISWTGVATGYYRLSVTATDSAGVPNTSAEQWLTVGAPGVPTPSIQQIGTFSNGPRAVAITDDAPETTIYYSIGYNGQDPGTPVPGASNTHKYTGPFVLYHGAAAVNAIAYHGNQQSALGHAAYDFQTKPLPSVGQNYGVISRLPDAYYNTVATNLPSRVTGGVQPGVEIVTGKAKLWAGVVGNEVAGWNLSYRSLESDARTGSAAESEQGWTVLSSGVGSSDLAPLGDFDTSLLPNGQFELRLRVYNQNYDPTTSAGQNQYTDTFRTVIVSGGQKVGPLNLSLADLTMPAPGFPIQLTRSYDSTDKTRGDFGIGWRLGISNIRVQTSANSAPDGTQPTGLSRRLGDGWKQLSNLGQFYLAETEAHYVSISLPGGAVYAFYPKVSDEGVGTDYPEYAENFGLTVSFAPVPGTQADRERPANASAGSPGARLFANVDGLWTTDIPVGVQTFDTGEQSGQPGVSLQGARLLTEGGGSILDVKQWMLQTRDGTQYYMDADKGITQIVDRNGNTMTYDYVMAGDANGNTRGYQVSAVHTYHSTSAGLQPTRSLTISRPHVATVNGIDIYGYVTSVTNGVKEVDYTQDTNEDLTAATVKDLTKTPPPTYPTTYAYDRQHNLVTLQAPAVTQSGETGPLATIQPSVTNVYNDEGRLVATVDAAGKQTVQSQFVSERRALVTDPLGHQSLIAYDDVGNVRLTAAYVTETNPNTGVTTTRVVQSTADYGFWSSSGSDGSGEAMSRFAGLKTQQQVQVNHDPATGAATEFQTTKFTYDPAFGDLVTVSDPRDGSGATVAEKVHYNARGQVTEVDDPRITDPAQQVQQKNAYDAAGNLLSTQDALGNATVYSDGDPSTTADNLLPDGSPRQVKDAAGNVTRFTYVQDGDPNAGQVSRIDGPGGTVTTFAYQPTGEKASQTVQRQGQLNEDGSPVTTPASLKTSFEYDFEGRLTRTIAPQNQNNPNAVLARTEYDALGKVAARYDNYNRATRYVYDVKGHLVKTVAPDGSLSQTQYDDAGRVTQTTASSGQVSTTVYDALGRVSQTASTDLNGANPIYTRSDYDDAGRVLATYDDRGSGWVPRSATTYDLAGNVLTNKDRDALLNNRVSATYHYDPQGRNDWVQDARGFYTVYQFDALNRVTKTYFGATGTNTSALDATCAWTQTIYDSLGRKVEERTRENPNDQNDVKITAYHYDAAGRLDQVTQVMDTATWLSTTDTDPDNIRDPGGINLKTQYGYDSTGNKVWQQDAEGVHKGDGSRKTLFGYDAAGRMVWRKLPMGQVERMAYDNLTGRLLNTTDFTGYITTLHYFGIAPQNGPPSSQEQVGATDPRYGMLWEKQPDGRLTDQVGITYDYYTDAARKGRRWKATYGTDRTVWDYDARGRVGTTDSEIVDQAGNVAGPTRRLAYGYDIAGNKTGLTVALLGNHGQDSATAFSLGYRYDESDRMKEVWDTTLTGGVINGNAAQLAAYAYNPNGSLETVQRGNGVTTTYRYNSRNELDWMTHAPPANNPQANLGDARAFVYRTDLSGKRTAMFVGGEVAINGGVPSPGQDQLGTRYTYDKAGRLKKEERADGTTTAWDYDRVGNRKTQTVTGPGNAPPVVTTYNYDDNDRLLSEGITTNGTTTSQKIYDWNANGQMTGTLTNDGSTLKAARYDYNFTGTLARIRAYDPNNPMARQDYVQFDYDADGHRLGYVKVHVNPTGNGPDAQEVHRFAIDGQQPFAEVVAEYGDPANDTAWAEQARYAIGLDRLAMARPTGANNALVASWYLCDGLGSTRALTDASGNLTDGYGYEAFGKPTRVAGTASAATLNAFLFNGQQFDGAVGGVNGLTAGTGGVSDFLPGADPMYFLRARYYQQGNGRFTRADTYAGRQLEPASLHRYLYGNANPIINSDPSGMFSMGEMMTALSMAFNLVSAMDNFSAAAVFRSTGDDAAANLAIALGDLDLIGVGSGLLGSGTGTGASGVGMLVMSQAAILRRLNYAIALKNAMYDLVMWALAGNDTQGADLDGMSPGDVETAITNLENTSSPESQFGEGQRFMGKTARFIKDTLGIRVTEVNWKVKRPDGTDWGDIDVGTPNFIVEATSGRINGKIQPKTLDKLADPLFNGGRQVIIFGGTKLTRPAMREQAIAAGAGRVHFAEGFDELKSVIETIEGWSP